MAGNVLIAKEQIDTNPLGTEREDLRIFENDDLIREERTKSSTDAIGNTTIKVSSWTKVKPRQHLATRLRLMKIDSGKNIVDKQYTQIAYERILARMSNGEMLTSICEESDTPLYSVFCEWTIRSPDNFRKYQRAKELQVDYLIDDTLRIADTETDVAMARQRIAARQWLAIRISPHKYSETIRTENTVDVSVKAKIDLSSMDPDLRTQLKEELLRISNKNLLNREKTIDHDVDEFENEMS